MGKIFGLLRLCRKVQAPIMMLVIALHSLIDGLQLVCQYRRLLCVKEGRRSSQDNGDMSDRRSGLLSTLLHVDADNRHLVSACGESSVS